jgi:phosphoribosylaminoimidazolecarboxamide formyltransferase/IMP cyclohydrolase
MIHGGILFDRNQAQHRAEVAEAAIRPIDLVVVNLYDFAKARSLGLPLEKAIESIDIGGPTMLRAAAKNYQHCLPVIDPADYDEIIRLLEAGQMTSAKRQIFAGKVFRTISSYDQMIAAYFESPSQEEAQSGFPGQLNLSLAKAQTLRYGENPHQQGALYRDLEAPEGGFMKADVIQGKALSYNNYLDLDAAYRLVADLPGTAVAIIKHTNPCGVACSNKLPLAEIYAQALACDPTSAFGGIIATNRTIDGKTAALIKEIFFECIVAPDFDREALQILSEKKNLRLLKVPAEPSKIKFDIKAIEGAYLVQQSDQANSNPASWNTVTKVKATSAQIDDLAFAFTVCKHVKSNAIVLAKDGRTLGIGAGQMSRIDSLAAAIKKASQNNVKLEGAVLASDAFFPFGDCVEESAKHGIKAIVQPGGSIRDEESIQACDKHQINMMFTGTRHFRH